MECPSFDKDNMTQFVVDLKHKSIPEQLRTLVKSVVDGWGGLEDSSIAIKEVSGGITNILFRASIENGEDSSVNCVLVRVYGNQTELIIDRKKEIQNIRRLYKTGLGPKLYGTFKNGYVYEYYEGRSVNGEELHSCRWNEKLGETLAIWHKYPLTEKKSGMWETINHWLDLVPSSYDNPKKDADFAKLGGIGKIREEYHSLMEIAEQLQSPIVFSHNDLLGGNIIVNESNGQIKFIDFEYADANYQAFDIANHFNEWAGFEADYSRYPNKEQQYQFFKPYLKEYLGKEPTEEELHKLYVQVNKFALISHFYWGVWSLVQGSISSIDFDFVDYAVLRFQEMYKRKQEFLSLQ